MLPAGTRILGRYTLNNARMLVPEIWPFPRASRRPGRVQVCSGGIAHETQVAYLTPAEARELATSGTVAEFPAAGAAAASAAPVVPLHAAGALEPVGLRQAVAEGVVPVSLEAVRSARARDAEFPRHVAEGAGGEWLYDPDQLRSWARNRERAAAGA